MANLSDVDDGSTDVEFRAVTKRFGDLTAVRELSFRVRQGEFLALLGPSGCGKTTSLRMIAGFEAPDAGTILIGGEDVTGMPPGRRPVNTVFQDYAIFGHLSVRRNVEFGLKQRGVGRAERADRAMEALEMVRLADRAEASPRKLSGGQRQRVALARALVLRPRVLLLDEPLAALDLQLRKEMQVELRRLHRELGVTFVFVTHDQTEAMSMADRIAVMDEGRIEQLATPEEVYERPATPFVASFIGEMNHLEGSMPGSEPGLATTPLGPLTLPDPPPLVEGGRLRVGLRPESLSVRLPREPLPSEHVTSARVLEVGLVGEMCRLTAELEDGTTMSVRRPRSEWRFLRTLRPGDVVQLTWDPDDVLVLGAAAAR
jgi:spermidine/putrescine ABC transporter ATP-binding subunit